MTSELKKKIRMYIKNKLDISSLIQNENLKGEDLSGAIIKTFNRIEDNLSGCDFSRCIIGEENKITNLSGTKFLHCRFNNTKFLGKTFLRHCDCRHSSFVNAWCPMVEWQFSDVTDCNFCEITMTLGTDYLYKTKVDENLFKDLTKYLNIEVKMKEPLTNVKLEEKYKK